MGPLSLAPFFKRYFAVDGYTLWVREPGRWQLVFAWRLPEEVTPRQLSWRNGNKSRGAFSTPRFVQRLDRDRSAGSVAGLAHSAAAGG